MKRSLTTRCISVFLLLDVLVSVLLVLAVPALLGLTSYAGAHLVMGVFAAAKVVGWMFLLGRFLDPYERFQRQASGARTRAGLLDADRALMHFPIRFGAAYALSLAAATGLSAWWIWSFADPPLEATRGAHEVLLLVILAVVSSAFAFAFPLSTHLTTEAANSCSSAAREEGAVLERTPISLHIRIAIVTVCVALAPALWMTAVGYQAVAATRAVGFTSNFAVSAGLFVLVVMLWAPFCASMLGRVVSEPIFRLTAATRLVVEEGKLSRMGALPVAREDEVGELIGYFNQVLALMRSLAEAANAVAEGDLLVQVDGVGELPDAFRGMLGSLSAIVRQIRGSSIELASAAAEIFAAAQEQESAATAQSSAMVEISRTMESLSLSAAHVSEAVQGVLGNAERTLKNTDDMVDRIGSLTRHAGRIGEILEVIRDISDRSDLLALNGSLEASRAGEAGRGFALVAGEMRRLAERVTASVQDVKKLVSDIRDSGSSTVIATEESRKLADGTTEAARQITFVSQQQRSGTEQVSQSVKNIAEVVSQAASATSEIRTAAEGLKTHADRLADVVRKFDMPAEERA
jgi:methyl-accepting chemotaxis protein